MSRSPTPSVFARRKRAAHGRSATAVGLALGLGSGLAAVSAAWAPDRGRDAGPPALAAAAVAAAAVAGPLEPRLVGSWLSQAGVHILVARSGAAWADPDLLGRLEPDGSDPSRFLFTGAGFRCRYVVRSSGPRALVWALQERADGSRCPEGTFRRPPAS